MTEQGPLPFAPSCENNKNPILKILGDYLPDIVDGGRLLEIGGGTAQHASYFASHFNRLIWQSSEQEEHLATLNCRIEAADLTNLPAGISLNVDENAWRTPENQVETAQRYHAVFTANTLHIMSFNSVHNFFAGLAHHLLPGGLLIIYGPFKYGGEFTSPSNSSFDLWLKERNSQSGVRDFEALDELAQRQSLDLVADHCMPANNQMLIWRKSTQSSRC